MSDSLKLFIDLNEAGLDLEREELEQFSLDLGDEMQGGELVEDARLAREEELPDRAKSGAAAFIMGVLMTEVNRENIKKAVDWLGIRFYGKTLTFSYEDADGTTVKFDHRNQAEFEQALQGAERLAMLRLRIQQGAEE
ncbi:MAG: hypothetical protein QNJ46_27760 [Leptolyngbyaceae cyanobacterium MO_188.B28]|nr:hypothetical protein [Leptolyngbyaceae cyanobacterium MO_188.B28]